MPFHPAPSSDPNRPDLDDLRRHIEGARGQCAPVGPVPYATCRECGGRLEEVRRDLGVCFSCSLDVLLWNLRAGKGG